MNREVLFYNQVMQQRAGSDMRNPSEIVRVALYLRRASDLAKAFEIENFPTVNIGSDLPEGDAAMRQLLPPYYAVESFMNGIYARNIFEIDGSLKQEFVPLDDDWRQRAMTYLAHVRNAVSNAELPERLRQSIMTKLHELQHEIDRRQTRLTSVMGALAELCEGVASGAKTLEPAVRLVEKMAGAFSGLRRQVIEQQPAKQLPAPDTLGLPAPDDSSAN